MVENGFKLEKTKEFKRILYYFTNNKEEFPVSIALIKKLESLDIIDSNWDINKEKLYER